jgi:hypothetical protein
MRMGQMDQPTDGRRRAWGTIVLLLLILLSSAANIILTLRLRDQVSIIQQVKQQAFTCRVRPSQPGSFSKTRHARRSSWK